MVISKNDRGVDTKSAPPAAATAAHPTIVSSAVPFVFAASWSVSPPATSEPQLHPSVCSLTMLLSPKLPPHGGSFSVQYRSHNGSTLWFSQQMLSVARVSVWASASLMLPLSAARYLLTSLLRKFSPVKRQKIRKTSKFTEWRGRLKRPVLSYQSTSNAIKLIWKYGTQHMFDIVSLKNGALIKIVTTSAHRSVSYLRSKFWFKVNFKRAIGYVKCNV